MPRHEPTLTIAGVALPASWDGSARVALDGITLDWGRESVYDQPDPTRATVTVIDPGGLWATGATLYGAKLTIARPLAVMFRGSIDSISLEPVVVTSPRGNRPARVWLVTITAIDPAAALAKAIPTGPGPYGAQDANWRFQNAIYGANHWAQALATTRLTELGARADGIVDGFAPTTAAGNWLIGTHPMADKMSLLDLARECYSSVPLAHANYNAQTNRIELGALAPATGLSLTLVSSRITLGPVAGHTLDARLIEQTSGGKITSALGENIATVILNHLVAVPASNITFEGVSRAVSRTDAAISTAPVPTSSPNLGRNVLELNTGIYDAPDQTTFGRIATLSALVVALVAKLNGKPPAPATRFDLERFDFGAAEAILLDTKDQPVPLYLAGALHASLNFYGPLFQLIGGRLTYKKGWTLEAILGPTVTAPATLTVAALVTNTTPLLGDYAPEISLADLGHVTKGLA